MARARKKDHAVTASTEADTSFNPAEFEQQNDAAAHEGGDRAQAELSQHTATLARNGHAPGHIANPSATRREGHAAAVDKHKRPSRVVVPVGGGISVVLNDYGNKYGIGIQVDLPEGRKPAPEELEIIRTHVNNDAGFHWDKPEHLRQDREVPKMWFKPIRHHGERLEDIPSARAVAIRLDAENRVHALADALKQHQADPVGYADRIRQEREQAPQDRIPD